MSKPEIITITNPVDLILAQLSEIRDGNTTTQKEIERLQTVLKGGYKAEARLEAKLEKLLAKHQAAKKQISTEAELTRDSW